MHVCVRGYRSLIRVFSSKNENTFLGKSLLDPKVNGPCCNPRCINGGGCGVCHLEGNSISFSVFLLGFYLDYLGKIRQPVFEIENHSVISGFITPLQP